MYMPSHACMQPAIRCTNMHVCHKTRMTTKPRTTRGWAPTAGRGGLAVSCGRRQEIYFFSRRWRGHRQLAGSSREGMPARMLIYICSHRRLSRCVCDAGPRRTSDVGPCLAWARVTHMHRPRTDSKCTARTAPVSQTAQRKHWTENSHSKPSATVDVLP